MTPLKDTAQVIRPFFRQWAFGMLPVCGNCESPVAVSAPACVSRSVSLVRVFLGHAAGGSISGSEGVCTSSSTG